MKGIHWTPTITMGERRGGEWRPVTTAVAQSEVQWREREGGFVVSTCRGSTRDEWLLQLTNEQLTQLIKSYRVTARHASIMQPETPWFLPAPRSPLFLRFHQALRGATEFCTMRNRRVRSSDLLTPDCRGDYCKIQRRLISSDATHVACNSSFSICN